MSEEWIGQKTIESNKIEFIGEIFLKNCVTVVFFLVNNKFPEKCLYFYLFFYLG